MGLNARLGEVEESGSRPRENEPPPGKKSSALKIGLITSHYPPDLTGASEFVAHAQARELIGRAHEVRVVTGCSWPHSGRDVLRGRIDDADVSYLPRTIEESASSEHGCARWTRLALDELRGVDVYLVHADDSLPLDLLPALARRRPVVVCVNDLPANAGVCEQLGCADQVIVPSADLKRALLELAPSLVGKLEVRQSGLCRVIPPMHVAQRRAPWDGERPLSLFHFGRRTSASGLSLLIKSLRDLPSGRFELVLAGGEGEAGLDDHLGSLAGELPLHFFGPYQTSQLAALAAACDLAVFPSGTDRGLGLVIDEALALGLPVWCCEQADPLGRIRPSCDPASEAGRGGLKRVESRPGRILAADSPTDWSQAFEDLLEDPEQLHTERHAVPRSFETTKDAVDRLESRLESLLSETFSKAS